MTTIRLWLFRLLFGRDILPVFRGRLMPEFSMNADQLYDRMFEAEREILYLKESRESLRLELRKADDRLCEIEKRMKSMAGALVRPLDSI